MEFRDSIGGTEVIGVGYAIHLLVDIFGQPVICAQIYDFYPPLQQLAGICHRRSMRNGKECHIGFDGIHLGILEFEIGKPF